MDLHQEFRRLVDEHYGSVWACVCALTGRDADAEDLVHQAFLLAFERLADGMAFAGDPGKWLRGTARNLVFAWWRENRKMSPDLAGRLEELVSESEGPLDRAAREDVRAALRGCMDRLSPEERDLVRRRYENDERASEIAAATDVNVVTVRTRLFRVRQALKGCLESVLGGALFDGR